MTATACAVVKLGQDLREALCPNGRELLFIPVQRRQDVKRIPLIIFGAGKVGRALVGQLTAAAQYHAERDGLSFSVVAWCDNDGAAVAERGLNAADLQAIAAANTTRRGLS